MRIETVICWCVIGAVFIPTVFRMLRLMRLPRWVTGVAAGGIFLVGAWPWCPVPSIRHARARIHPIREIVATGLSPTAATRKLAGYDRFVYAIDISSGQRANGFCFEEDHAFGRREFYVWFEPWDPPGSAAPKDRDRLGWLADDPELGGSWRYTIGPYQTGIFAQTGLIAD